MGSSSRDADGRSFQRYGDGSFDDCVKNRGLIGGGVGVAPALRVFNFKLGLKCQYSN